MRNTPQVTKIKKARGSALAKNKVVFDERKYSRLLAKIRPRIIRTEEENERMLELIEPFIDNDDLSVEEQVVCDLMFNLIENFERGAYPMSGDAPHLVLRSLMEQHRMMNADLMPIFKSSGYLSDILNGKRAISKNKAKALAEKFNISADVFL